MTELEMSLSLDIVVEPTKNYVLIDPLLQAEILYLRHIFAIQKIQRNEMGHLNQDSWVDLLPWHSSN